MALSAADVVGRWVFSHDEGDARVFGPRSTARPSRAPREAFDVNADGTFRRYEPGSGDAPAGVEGRWTLADPDRIDVAYEGGRPAESIVVVEATPGTLRIRGKG